MAETLKAHIHQRPPTHHYTRVQMGDMPRVLRMDFFSMIALEPILVGQLSQSLCEYETKCQNVQPSKLTPLRLI